MPTRRCAHAAFTCAMSADIIVSYDGTPNDDDADRARAACWADRKRRWRWPTCATRASSTRGARSSPSTMRRAPARAGRGAARRSRRRPARGDQRLTGEGLAKLAAVEGASVIVFGSDYRTPPGRVEPGTSAQNLLEGGPSRSPWRPPGCDPGGHEDPVDRRRRPRNPTRSSAHGRGAGRPARRDGGRRRQRLVRSDRGRLAGRGHRRADRAQRRHAVGAGLRAGEVLVLPRGTAALT